MIQEWLGAEDFFFYKANNKKKQLVTIRISDLKKKWDILWEDT